MAKEPKKSSASSWDELLVPTYPTYDWDADPGEQPEYTNPVSLNNCVIRWVNAAIRITQRLVATNKRIGQAKVALEQAEAALDDFEQELLRTNPAPASATKSLKLLDAYLNQVAVSTGKADDYRKLIGRIREIRQRLRILEMTADNCRHIGQTLKLAGEHAMTHLSFVKTEAAAARKGI